SEIRSDPAQLSRLRSGGPEKFSDGDPALDPGTRLDEGTTSARAGVRLQNSFPGASRIARRIGVLSVAIFGSGLFDDRRRGRMDDDELRHRTWQPNSNAGRDPVPSLA